jgi:D-alanyl-D-alanine carboxypeptidase (penicillin-binding protein 5/6)
MELIAVVMGCETSTERFAACKSMLDYGFANFSLVTPQFKGELELPVKLGSRQMVKAVPGEDAQLLIDKSQKDMVTTDFTLEESVTAPVSKGQRLGTMTVRAGEQILAQIPLVAETEVSRLSWGQLFIKLLSRIAMAKQ